MNLSTPFRKRRTKTPSKTSSTKPEVSVTLTELEDEARSNPTRSHRLRGSLGGAAVLLIAATVFIETFVGGIAEGAVNGVSRLAKSAVAVVHHPKKTQPIACRVNITNANDKSVAEVITPPGVQSVITATNEKEPNGTSTAPTTSAPAKVAAIKADRPEPASTKTASSPTGDTGTTDAATANPPVGPTSASSAGPFDPTAATGVATSDPVVGETHKPTETKPTDKSGADDRERDH